MHHQQNSPQHQHQDRKEVAAMSLSPIQKWKKEQQEKKKIFYPDNNNNISMIRMETEQLLTEQNMKRNKREFQIKVESELLQSIAVITDQNSSIIMSDHHYHYYTISELVVLLNALRFFDSERADLSVKLFELVLGKLKEARQEYLDFVSATKMTKEQQKEENEDDENKKNKHALLIRKKLEFTKVCRAASFALQICSNTGIVKASDMDQVLEIILTSTRNRDIFIDAGCLARCTLSLLLFNGLLGNSSTSSSSSSPVLISQQDSTTTKHTTNHHLLLLDSYLGVLGKIPATKFHDGSIRSSLALEFLQLLTVFPQIKSLLRRTRSEHLVEHLCFVIAGRSNLRDFYDNHNHHHNNNTRKFLPRVVKSRVPFPEQLQKTQHLCSKLNVFFPWLDSQLVQEASLCQGVLVNQGEPRDELERLHHQQEEMMKMNENNINNNNSPTNSHGFVDLSAASSSQEDQEMIQQNLKELQEENNMRVAFPKHYPVMNYVEAFGDEQSPEPTVWDTVRSERRKLMNLNRNPNHTNSYKAMSGFSSHQEESESSLSE